MPAPKWAVGMIMLSPGIYVDERSDGSDVHVDEAELCAWLGWPLTEQNAARAASIAVEAVRKAFGKEGIPLEVRHIDE